MLLRAHNLSKSFGTLPALQQVSLSVHAGEVVGLAGQNGSGKSVLLSLLAGLTVPDTGELTIDSTLVRWPFAARPFGIEVIHQYPDLADGLDVGSNLFLGNEIAWPGPSAWLKIPHRRRTDEAASALLARLDLDTLSPREKVSNLSAEQRQLVAIARAMSRPARLIIIDQPTPLLGYAAQQKLQELVQEWQRQGVAVLFASDNLDHLFAVSDRMLVLRAGRVVGERRTDATSREELVEMMVSAADRQQLTPTIWALDSYYQAREQAEQLQAQERLLQRDLMAQGTLNRELVERLAEQVTALDRANASLQDAQRRLLTEREEERKHLSRELHDVVIQDLLSLNYQLEEMASRDDLDESARDDVDDVRSSIRALVSDLRHICGSLRPPTIDSLGLGAAIQSFTREWAERTGVAVQLEIDPALGRLPEAIELSVFRMVQEGLSNVRKHAQASTVSITLKHTTPRMLLVALADDGRGLPQGTDLATLASEGHYGLLGISERVALLGGRLSLQNQRSGGLHLRAEIPHPRVL
ncbi:MAG: ATP-binding cassette domain-containing protein [Chloroflexaceae bacterium]|nr:ATP-binding cassette domain-containing protein [Chloroflexaceae bacterium]